MPSQVALGWQPASPAVDASTSTSNSTRASIGIRGNERPSAVGCTLRGCLSSASPPPLSLTQQRLWPPCRQSTYALTAASAPLPPRLPHLLPPSAVTHPATSPPADNRQCAHKSTSVASTAASTNADTHQRPQRISAPAALSLPRIAHSNTGCSSHRFVHNSPSTSLTTSDHRRPHSLRPHARPSLPCRASSSSSSSSSSRPSEARLQQLVQVLSCDLPQQYSQDLQWHVYSDDVAFADPATVLEGKLQYRGMIVTLRGIVLAAFDPSSVSFDLIDIHLVAEDSLTTSPYAPRAHGIGAGKQAAAAAIRTVWVTRGRTRWGKHFQISGDDIFRVNRDGLIYFHESAWNESPQFVWDSFRP